MKQFDYSPVVFANLHDFHIVNKLPTSIEDKLPLLGDVICEYNVEHVLGISLLHKHFNLYEDEILVRSFQNNELTITPKINGEQDVIPYMWCFSKRLSEENCALYPVEFLEPNNVSETHIETAQEVITNKTFLNNIWDILRKNNLQNLFGLSVIPNNLFTIGDDETLFETDNHAKRELKVIPTSIDHVQQTDSTQTLWTFTNKDQNTNLNTYCGAHCGIHCGVHCSVHCGVHCGIHWITYP